jgi:hypothetical protein
MTTLVGAENNAKSPRDASPKRQRKPKQDTNPDAPPKKTKVVRKKKTVTTTSPDGKVVAVKKKVAKGGRVAELEGIIETAQSLLKANDKSAAIAVLKLSQPKKRKAPKPKKAVKTTA